MSEVIYILRAAKDFPIGGSRIFQGKTTRARYVIQRQPSHSKGFRSLCSLFQRKLIHIARYSHVFRVLNIRDTQRARIIQYLNLQRSVALHFETILTCADIPRVTTKQQFLHNFLRFAEIPDYTWSLADLTINNLFT